MEQFVEVRGARLAVERQGAGRPFLWGHGLTESRGRQDHSGLFDWGEVRAAGVEVLRYDARSHGRSSVAGGPADHEWRALAGDLLGLLDALDLGTVAAGGVSMGCAATLLAAQEAPDRFGALVLTCPPTAWDTRAAQADLYRAGADLVETEGVEALADVIAGLPVPRLFEATPELASFEPDVIAAALPAVLRGAAASDLPDPESLRALDAPALVLAWEGDRGHPVSTAERLAEVLPAAELVVAADLDAVRRWPPLVADWLARTL